MVQAADILPLVAKDGALPLLDLGRLALTTSKAIGATISGDNGADPWLCLCRRRLGLDLIRQLGRAGLLPSQDDGPAVSSIIEDGDTSSSERPKKRRRRQTANASADPYLHPTRTRSRYEQLFRLLVLNDLPRGCGWSCANSPLPPPPLTVDPERPRIPRLDPLDRSLQGYALVVQLFGPEPERTRKRAPIKISAAKEGKNNGFHPQYQRRPAATLVIPADRLQGILSDGRCEDETFALDRPVVFDTLSKSQFYDKNIRGGYSQDDPTHPIHDQMFGLFDRSDYPNIPEQGRRWNVVMHLMHRSEGDGAGLLSGLCIHESDHAGPKAITLTNMRRCDWDLDQLSPLMAEHEDDWKLFGVLDSLAVCGKELPLTHDAIRCFERLTYRGIYTNADGTYTHKDIWTGISFGIELVCDVVDVEGEDDMVGLCFREIGLSAKLEDVDDTYLTDSFGFGFKENFGMMCTTRPTSIRRTRVAHVLEKAGGWKTF